MEHITEFDHDLLRGRIKQICGSEAAFGKAIGLSSTAISNRINNKTNFNLDEVLASASVLDIPAADIPRYFLTLKVQ